MVTEKQAVTPFCAVVIQGSVTISCPYIRFKGINFLLLYTSLFHS